ALGVDVGRLSFVHADRLIEEPGYWTSLLRVSKRLTLARVRRALTILGRRVSERDIDFAKLIYPSMQVTDIFTLGVNLCLGGEDQRRAHVLAREVAPKIGRDKPVAVHTPLLIGLQGVGRMGVPKGRREDVLIDAKMSKSRPETCIFVHDAPAAIRRKILKAYCPPGEVAMNPVLEIARHVVFPRVGALLVGRPRAYGGPLTLNSYEDLVREYIRGLHPLDVKTAVADALIGILSPVREYFRRHPSYLRRVESMAITR
ncbi:TPA: tyrosine--tRNA ligase, partial [Candidatus Bathyarchaeota archaeon]|nr:tyrosine--tRNA ligase [Candidatus Bathyarchaeota archaeon]